VITVLTKGRLLDCVGDEPLENASVVIEDGDIKDVYSGEKALPKEATVINVGGRTIMPGLTDAHMHVAYTHPSISMQFQDPPIVTALLIKDNCERILQAGFTSVYDMGMANQALKKAIDDGIIKGPRLRICNAMLSPTAGHSDFYNPVTRTGVPEDIGLYAMPRIVDGVDEARKAAREQFRAGADCLKAMVTGGVLSPHDEVWHVQFSEGELRAFVEEAEDVGKYLAVHAEGLEGAKRALKCGAKAIHHVFYCDDEFIQMLKEKDAFHVPTLTVMVKALVEHSDEIAWPAYTKTKIESLKKIIPEMMQTTERIIKSGCNVGSGSDLIARIPLEGWEIKLKTECGMTPYQAIKSATVVNSKLFKMENSIGTIEVSKWADIIVVDGHPDEDAIILADPNNVRLVMKRGDIFKNTIS